MGKINKGNDSLELIMGPKVAQAVNASKLLVVGAGAIGCELLKNLALLGAGAAGEIVVTDPDHIENSNLSRQFLFREGHIRKPKSATAAAVIMQMAPALKGHILPYIERVDPNSENTFSNEFLKQRTVVINALDNVQARRYVDSRCVKNRRPLLDSGTLGPKGHVQVILPHRTESYGEQKDPVEETEIPHCTLKMFP
jgi:molybdopterin/thiamine biosynthesis adenylyltransferase